VSLFVFESSEGCERVRIARCSRTASDVRQRAFGEAPFALASLSARLQTSRVDAPSTFAFSPEPTAASLAAELFERFLTASRAGRALAARLREEAGTRLSDVVDVLSLSADAGLRARLVAAGFAPVGVEGLAAGSELFEHSRALLPLVELRAYGKARAYVRVDSVVDFLEASRITKPDALEGGAGAFVRRALVATEDEAELWVVERSAARRLVTSSVGISRGPGVTARARHLEAFRLRPRPLDEPERGFQAAQVMIRDAQKDLGEAVACELFFEAERRYYERRNRAARVQKARQDALGLGWHNRDHHTYRSSRPAFASLVRTLELLGLDCRERFYAGHEAGWGAQVMEHPELGICVFADVDLSPEEVAGDFAHDGLSQRGSLGTVGLWCELHGEAFLSAGMHHLECQFDFDLARAALEREGVPVMAPFTDFPHLRQAFTKGEIWTVRPERLARAVDRGLLTEAQAERLGAEGTLGSHFELLERNDGYKGFNQSGINRIITATDPRRRESQAPAAL
jgi:hypothetical protein